MESQKERKWREKGLQTDRKLSLIILFLYVCYTFAIPSFFSPLPVCTSFVANMAKNWCSSGVKNQNGLKFVWKSSCAIIMCVKILQNQSETRAQRMCILGELLNIYRNKIERDKKVISFKKDWQTLWLIEGLYTIKMDVLWFTGS